MIVSPSRTKPRSPPTTESFLGREVGCGTSQTTVPHPHFFFRGTTTRFPSFYDAGASGALLGISRSYRIRMSSPAAFVPSVKPSLTAPVAYLVKSRP